MSNSKKTPERRGEAEKRSRMLALYGENREITGSYDKSTSAVCENGVFVGKIRDGVISYKGIPYAKPPIGELRWKKPEAPEKSGQVFEAFYFGKSPIQTEWPSEEGSYYPQGEDCLTLNVWTRGGEGKKPVMVFFHGGSYGWGATSDMIYDGHNLVAANPDIVLVTVEYRVGIMGFIDFSKVPGGEEYKESGNLGLLDCLASLEWVRRNITAFGGDADTVTIVGESAGAGIVSLLPLLPAAKGLFRRVIAESGSVALTHTRERCYALAEKLCKNSGASGMKELLALSEDRLKELNTDLNDDNNFPEKDGIVLPENLYDAYASGVTSDVDMLIGTNADEIRYWIREMGYYSKEWHGPVVFRMGGPILLKGDRSVMSDADKKFMDDYMKSDGTKYEKTVEFYNDILFRTPAIHQTELHAKNGGNAYMYYWKYPSENPEIGACHAVELSYVFGNTDVKIYTGNKVCPGLSKKVQTMWCNFARGGNPSADGFVWEKYSAENRFTALIDEKIGSARNFRDRERELTLPLLKYDIDGSYTNAQSKVSVFTLLGAIISAIPTAFRSAYRDYKKTHSK